MAISCSTSVHLLLSIILYVYVYCPLFFSYLSYSLRFILNSSMSIQMLVKVNLSFNYSSAFSSNLLSTSNSEEITLLISTHESMRSLIYIQLHKLFRYSFCTTWILTLILKMKTKIIVWYCMSALFHHLFTFGKFLVGKRSICLKVLFVEISRLIVIKQHTFL